MSAPIKNMLTNHQRDCLGLVTVDPDWEMIALERSLYDNYDSYVYADGLDLKKLIQIGAEYYYECSLEEKLSDDGVYILPKTDKGKPVKFTAASIAEKKAVGMLLFYDRGDVALRNSTTGCSYYRSSYDNFKPKCFEEFTAWVNKWCETTDEKLLADIRDFAAKKSTHQKYGEGDFFRFRITRGLWGYGRILLNFADLKKEKREHWNPYMGKPLIVSVYHILTTEPISDINMLCGLLTLPSQPILDNIFYYGEAEIIGNKPLTQAEKDYPIIYGESANPWDENLYLQCGSVFFKKENTKPLYKQFHMIGWALKLTLPVLVQCISVRSNLPYWNSTKSGDLRNPALAKERKEILEQFGITEEDLKQ